MGGYGCLKAALSHPECYAGCAAISAVTNIHTKVKSTPDSAPKKQDFRAIFGENLLISDQDDLYTLALQAKVSGKPLPDFHLFCGYRSRSEFSYFILRSLLQDVSSSPEALFRGD